MTGQQHTVTPTHACPGSSTRSRRRTECRGRGCGRGSGTGGRGDGGGGGLGPDSRQGRQGCRPMPSPQPTRTTDSDDRPTRTTDSDDRLGRPTRTTDSDDRLGRPSAIETAIRTQPERERETRQATAAEKLPSPSLSPGCILSHLEGHLGRHVGRGGLEGQRAEGAVEPARRDREGALPAQPVR